MSIDLETLCDTLERLAPLASAEPWDNVGLILDARGPTAGVSRVLLAIDLTETVLDEALVFGAEAIVSYHPPLFSGVKRLRASHAGERVAVRALAAGLAVYSPHTALDAAPGGLGDWLAEGLGAGAIERRDGDGMAEVVRRFVLAEPASLTVVVDRVKTHLGLTSLRVAACPAHRDGAPVRRIAMCPGAGGSAFEGIADVDVFWTGEMRHHDVLGRVASGASVILSEHTHTERGYLPVLGRRLGELLGDELTVRVSKADREPLELV